MQDLRNEKPINQKGLEREKPMRSNLKANQKGQINLRQPESDHLYNWDKKSNHSNACHNLKN